MIEDGKTGQPLRRRCVGKGAQDIPTVRIGVIPALPVGIGGGAMVVARLDAPGLSSLDREGAGAAGRTLEMEGLQAHVLDGKEHPWGQTRLLHAEGGSGLGHRLIAPPRPHRERAGEKSDSVGLRWHRRGAARSGARCVGQGRYWPGRAADGVEGADIPNDATGPPALRRQRTPRSVHGPRSARISRAMDDPPTIAIAMVRQYCAAVGEHLHGG